MQLKQVADLLGVDNKEVIQEVESQRDDFTAKGFKIAKKLTAASAFEPEAVKLILASFDVRRQKQAEAEKESDDKRRREEEERQREAQRIQREKEEEERRAKLQAARAEADAKIARVQAEIARQEEIAKLAAEAKAAAEAAAAAATPQPQDTTQPPPPPSIQHPTASAPTSAPRPMQPRTSPPGPTDRPQGPRPPYGRPTGPTTGPAADQGRPRPPWPDRRGPHDAPPTDQRRFNREGQAPRPAGPAGPRPSGPGAGPRGPRTGAPVSRDQAGRSGDNRGRRDTGAPARAADIQTFLDTGIQSDVTDDFRRTQARRTKTTRPTATPDTTAWTEDGKPRKAAKPAVDDGAKKIRPTQIYNVDALSDRRPKPRKRPVPGAQRYEPAAPTRNEPKVATFYGDFTVGEFADKTAIGISEVMTKLFAMGRMVTINQLLDPDIAEELALEFEIEIRIERESDDADVARYLAVPDPANEMRPRPPVVTVMGHVDHGKTSLLDRIRKANVAASEFGGITQHIGAYQVSTPKGDVVFLDTPGHEAFTEMRSRGANITDLVVLVVAANDGVMPQTVEAINHAKAANVPILVAINKIDMPGANPERVKQELMKYELVSEEYGGDTIILPVSAATGQGIDSLLEYVALQTEILELKANPNRSAVGAVVESHMDPLRGAVATILVRAGTLHIGDSFVCGTEHGRIRAMSSDRELELTEAGPATPVEILGLRGSPAAGEKFVVLPTEMEARDIAERRLQRRKKRKAFFKKHISLDNLAERIGEEDGLQLSIITKADVQGSAEAINNALLKIRSDKVAIRILHSAVGAVTVSDVQLADASEAIIIAFNVGVDTGARDLGEELGVDIRKYQIIYALLGDIEKAMMGMLSPEFEEKEEGRAKVLQIFKVSRIGTVAGCFVEEGVIANSHQARLVRDGAVIWRGKIKSLRRIKDDVKQVLAGLECGIGLENYNDVKEGDLIESYSLVEQAVSLISSEAVPKA